MNVTPRTSDVTIALLCHNRIDEVLRVLDLVKDLPHHEVIVVDSGSTDGTSDAVRKLDRSDIVLIECDNIAVEGRNVGVAAATTPYVLILDDDAYPLPGTIERLTQAFDANPRLGVAGGFMIDVTADAQTVRSTEVGTFDWFLRDGRDGPPPIDGFPAYFFAEGGAMVRREAYQEVGGFFAPYFFTQSELDLTMRMISAGWDVTYVPDAVVHHLKAGAGRTPGPLVLELRVRNQAWFWLRHFPWWSVALHLVFYGLFDLVEAVNRGQVRAWARGLLAAARGRDVALSTRDVKPMSVRRRAGRGRARIHLRLLKAQLQRRLASTP